MSDRAVVAAVTRQLKDVSEETVAAVIQAWNAIKEGPSPGTVLINPANGDVAVRVSDSGVHYWQVVALDGTVWKDANPNLGWDVLKNAGN
jgi:hypothetical protein